MDSKEKAQFVPFALRLPADLKRHLEERAAENMRSLNGEIVARLRESRGKDPA